MEDRKMALITLEGKKIIILLNDKKTVEITDATKVSLISKFLDTKEGKQAMESAAEHMHQLLKLSDNDDLLRIIFEIFGNPNETSNGSTK